MQQNKHIQFTKVNLKEIRAYETGAIMNHI